MTPKRIVILGHWHSGTSLLAHQLRVCGMHVGNKNTFWNSDCEAQCEHSELNAIGDALDRGASNIDLSRINTILESYVKEGNVHKWTHYGVKITHVLQENCGLHFLPVFDSIWGPDTKYIIIVRRPLAIVRSTERDPKWSADRVLNSISSTHKNISYILNNKSSNLIVYPTAWYDGTIERLVHLLGLYWCSEAEQMFDPKRVRSEDWNKKIL